MTGYRDITVSCGFERSHATEDAVLKLSLVLSKKENVKWAKPRWVRVEVMQAKVSKEAFVQVTPVAFYDFSLNTIAVEARRDGRVRFRVPLTDAQRSWFPQAECVKPPRLETTATMDDDEHVLSIYWPEPEPEPEPKPEPDLVAVGPMLPVPTIEPMQMNYLADPRITALEKRIDDLTARLEERS